MSNKLSIEQFFVCLTESHRSRVRTAHVDSEMCVSKLIFVYTCSILAIES